MVKVDLVFNPIAESYATAVGTEWNPAVHKKVPCDWIKSARRWIGRDGLFVYFHKEEGTYVLADWIFKPGGGKGPGLMTELEVLSDHPDRGGARGMDAGFLKNRCTPIEALNRKIRYRTMELKKARQAHRDMEEHERKGVAKWLRKKMGNHTNIPALMAAGAFEFGLPKKGQEDRFKAVIADLKGRS